MIYTLAISGSIIPTVFNERVWSDPSLPLHDWSSWMHPYTPAQYAGFAVNLFFGDALGLFVYMPVMLVGAYGYTVMLRGVEPMRRVALAALLTAAVYVLAIVFLQNDSWSQNFGERRFVDIVFLLCVALAPALAAVRGVAARTAVGLAAAVSVAIAALGTVAPFAGQPGEPGLAFGVREFEALCRRAPVAGAIDAVLLVVLVVSIVRMTDRALAGATRAPLRRA